MADVRSYFVPFDLDSGGGTELVIGVNLRTTASGGSQEALGSQTGANSLPVVIASDQAAVAVDSELPAAAALTDNFANPTAPGVGAFGMLWDGATWDRAPGNSADGVLVNLGTNNDVTVSSADVQGIDAADAAITADPVTVGGRASTATPTAVTADGDAVFAWLDRQGAQKIVMVDDAGDSAMDGANDALRVNVVAGSGGGVTHVDDAAFTPAVDDGVPAFGMFDDTAPDSVDEGDAGILRMSANRNLYSTIRDAAGNERGVNVNASNQLSVSVDNAAAILVDTELPAAAALADDTANPTVPGVGGFMLGYDSGNTNWNRVEVDDAGHLQVDVLSGGGGAPAPTNPVTNTQTSVALAAGASANVDSAEAASKRLTQIDVWSSVAWKGEIHTVDNAVESGRLGVTGGPAMQSVHYNPPHPDYIQTGTTAGADNFRIAMTNLDDSSAADMHVVFHYED